MLMDMRRRTDATKTGEDALLLCWEMGRRQSETVLPHFRSEWMVLHEGQYYMEIDNDPKEESTEASKRRLLGLRVASPGQDTSC